MKVSDEELARMLSEHSDGRAVEDHGFTRLELEADTLARELIAARKVVESLKATAAVLQAEKGRSGGKPFTGTWTIPALNLRVTVREVLDQADAALTEYDEATK